ncbi:unnamed protein product [Staurois parvus]|uniref:Uncharacterized protein n=1 Tax=Staurois parvus TaxID=386267 RepID=A0ABN9B4T3_9NEOB|nr:unnamed protein product [Staurois parvus]
MCPCYGFPLLLSPSPHSANSATFRSPHTAGWFHIFIGCCMAYPLLARLHRHTLWLPHSGYGPVTARK